MKATFSTDNHQTFNSAEGLDGSQPVKPLEPSLIKKKELAKRLSVSTRTIDNWIAKRMIPFIQVSPRIYLYDFEAVLASLRKHYEVEAKVR